ncbi:HEAT repeat-containing protein 3-like [Macrosteles quadrilineatus]|uniref:HEAT repeat-containing protein 3-like n=1 Tax=Macrosteles quadrilineatus TaxID=74068 RepID=UPI0023E0CE5E|nr:HEAT repeat-containing protein 3-like [Macrosteles quadrilineatus]
MISLVLSKIEPLPVNVMDILSNCPATIKLMKRLVRLQCRAYLCLNNLVQVVELEMLGGAQNLYALFGQILSQEVCVNPLSPGVDNELLEAVTAAIRSILLRLAAEKCSGLEVVNDDVIQTLFKIGTSPEPRVQANIIRSTGTLGIIFNNETFLVKTIGNYLMNFVENQKALWLIAEALDALLDLFAEDCTDAAAIEIKLVIRLGTISHRFKAKVRQERKTLGEHHAIVSTVMTNLIPFIKYKEAKMPR